MEFLNHHASLYGTNFTHHYYNILYDLYQNYTDLYEFNSQQHHLYGELMDFFTSSLQTDFLTAYLASNDVVNNVILNEEFGSRLETFNTLRLRFLNNYNDYRNAMNTVHATLQQIRAMNPNFTVPLPPFHPIRVTPLEWFILDVTTEGTVNLDPVIFQYDDFSERSLQRLSSIAAAVNHQPIPVVVDNIISPYNQARQTLSSLPFNSFASPNSINLFGIEIEQRNSRARTRRAVRNLPSEITPIRSRSRSGSRSD